MKCQKENCENSIQLQCERQMSAMNKVLYSDYDGSKAMINPLTEMHHMQELKYSLEMENFQGLLDLLKKYMEKNLLIKSDFKKSILKVC